MRRRPSARQLRSGALAIGLVLAFAGVSLVAGDTLLAQGAPQALPEATAAPVATPAATQTPQAVATQALPAPAGDAAASVWLPQSGARYHLVATCSGMQGPREATLDEAIAQGFTACKRCGNSIETNQEEVQQ